MVKLTPTAKPTSVTNAMFDAVPAGDYAATISGLGVRLSKAGNEYLSLTLTITEGAQSGRKVWDNLNLWHERPEVQDLAWSRLRMYATAIGHKGALEDSDALLDGKLRLRLTLALDRMTGEMRTKIRRAYRADVAPLPLFADLEAAGDDAT